MLFCGTPRKPSRYFRKNLALDVATWNQRIHFTVLVDMGVMLAQNASPVGVGRLGLGLADRAATQDEFSPGR